MQITPGFLNAPSFKPASFPIVMVDKALNLGCIENTTLYAREQALGFYWTDNGS